MPTGSRLRRPPSWRVAAVATAVLVVCAACGSDEVRTDGEPPPTTMSVRAWSDAIVTACVELDERFAELSGAELGSVEDALEHADGVTDYADRLASVASRLAAASVEGEAISDFEQRSSELSDAAAALARATRDGDADAAADAVESVHAAGDEINALAIEMQLDECSGF